VAHASASAPAAVPYASPDVPALGGRNHFLLRRLHSLTGLIFGGYLVVHLLVNATLIEGVRGNPGGVSVFAEQVNKIHSLPFLVFIEWGMIYLPILFHTIYGIWITLTGQPNVGNYPYAKNWFYTLQRASAVVIVLFMVFHILGMKGLFGSNFAFNVQHSVESTKWHFQQHWSVLWVIYPLGVIASCYHLANGFWTAAITWGLTVSKQAQRRWGYACAGLFFFTLALGFIALIAVGRMADVQAPAWIK
jgi:succinate dehydrogenase / fumarate reductase, cytochrome b subunit